MSLMLRRRPKARTRVFNALCPAMTNAGLRIAPRADGSHVRVAIFIVNNRAETMERIRPHVKVGSSHDAAVPRGNFRVPGAAQHVVMRCRPGTVRVCGGPGSSVHRSTSLRAASHPGHAIASDAFVALFTFPTAHPPLLKLRRASDQVGHSLGDGRSRSRGAFAPGSCHLTFTHPESRGGRGAEGRILYRCRAGEGASEPRVSDAARVVRSVHDALASRRSTVAISRHAPLGLRIISGNALNERGFCLSSIVRSQECSCDVV